MKLLVVEMKNIRKTVSDFFRAFRDGRVYFRLGDEVEMGSYTTLLQHSKKKWGFPVTKIVLGPQVFDVTGEDFKEYIKGIEDQLMGAEEAEKTLDLIEEKLRRNPCYSAIEDGFPGFGGLEFVFTRPSPEFSYRGATFATEDALELIRDLNEYGGEEPYVVEYNGVKVLCSWREMRAFELG